jgi:pimeloyl-ACP methyl ester carboxylesterase
MKRLLLVVLALAGGLVALDFLAPAAVAPALLALERARSGLERKTVRAGDLDVVYLEGGAGEPLVLVHGFGADKDNFTRVAAHLTPRYRVLIPDLPGFGESAKPADASYTIPQQVAWLRAMLQRLGVARPHLGGSSMGGMIAVEYALRHPDEVASLWLLGPGGTKVAFDSELTRRMAETGANPLLARTPEEFAGIIEFVMAKPPFMPHSVRAAMAEAAAANYPLHARIFTVVGPPGVPTQDERLVGLAVPALVVFGTADRALNPKAAEVYDAAMPNAEVRLMDGIGHLPMIEAPDACAQDYLAFRAGL